MALTITNAGVNLMRDMLAGNVTTLASINYVAVGTSIQGTPATATQLANEVFRRQLTSEPNGASAGETLFNGYVAPTDTVGTAITEVGFFAGGSAAANSGTLVFYATYSHTHTSGESIQLTVDSTI